MGPGAPSKKRSLSYVELTLRATPTPKVLPAAAGGTSLSPHLSRRAPRASLMSCAGYLSGPVPRALLASVRALPEVNCVMGRTL